MTSRASRTTPIASIAVGLIAAVVGAVLCAVIVDVTDHKFGYAAVGLGLLVGLGMARTAPAWRPLPFVAAIVAVAGCLLADFFVDVTIVAEATDRGTLSTLTDVASSLELTRSLFSAGFEGLDVLFWALAAIAAYQLTNGAVTKASTAAPAAQTPAAAGAAAPADPTTAFSGQQAPWSAPADTSPAPQYPAPPQYPGTPT